MPPVRYATLAITFFSASVLGCSDPVSPAVSAASLPGAAVRATGAVLAHAEFDVFDSNDFVLSCMNGESTHWEGNVHVSIDVTTTPSGLTQEQINVAFAPDYYVERENGVRYYAQGPFPVNEHHLFGPITVIAGTAAGSWSSADGDVLVLGFHVQIMLDQNGNPILDKWSGACP